MDRLADMGGMVLRARTPISARLITDETGKVGQGDQGLRVSSRNKTDRTVTARFATRPAGPMLERRSLRNGVPSIPRLVHGTRRL